MAQEEGWSRLLHGAGLRPDAATLWVLEGLTYYLKPETVPGMLRVSSTGADGTRGGWGPVL